MVNVYSIQANFGLPAPISLVLAAAVVVVTE
jgi:hypothetical protein